MRIGALLIMMLLLTGLGQVEAATPQLQRMTKKDELAVSRVSLQCSALPEFRVETNGQRIDVLLTGTSLAPNLPLPPEDDKIVRVLLASKPGELLISILVHRIPHRVVATPKPARSEIELEITWNERGPRRPAIARSLSGQSLPGAEGWRATPRQVSAYTGRWQDFFNDFQVPVDIRIPMRYSFPILPPLRGENAAENRQPALRLAAAGHWQAAMAWLEARPGALSQNLERTLRAEALLRLGQARRGLSALPPADASLHPDLLQRCAYLRGLAQATLQQPYQARIALAPLLAAPAAQGPMGPAARLLAAELMLTIGKPEAADTLLAEHPWPSPLRNIAALRQAEVHTRLGRGQQAAPAFRQFLDRGFHPARQPASRLRAAQALFAAGEYALAEQLFTQLAEQLPQTNDQNKARFSAALAIYRQGKHQDAMLVWEEIQSAAPTSEAGFRSGCKILDHRMLQDEVEARQEIADGYGHIARRAPLRSLREEAALKQALVHYLHGERSQAAELLSAFRRNFSAGPLRPEADALLVELLPPLITQLIAAGDDRKAAALVEINRQLLLNGTMNWAFLPELAGAFVRLGLWDKACNSYLFLLDQQRGRDTEQLYYLPLVQLLYDRAQYDMAADFANRYRQRFPRGEDRFHLYRLQLAALQRAGRLDDADALMNQPGQPTDQEIAQVATHIGWQRQDLSQVIREAERLDQTGQALPAQGMLLQAEALYGTGQAQRALPLYEQLLNDTTHREQALFRCGQITLALGDRRAAREFFQQLVDKGTNARWRRLAQDALAESAAGR